MRDLKIFTKNIEDEALKQIYTLLELEPFKDCKVRIMPDVHAGAGCVIGFTASLGDKIIPNLVGVDIGCGMLCVNLGRVDLDLKKLDKVVRANIPAGFNVHNERGVGFKRLQELKCYRELKNTQRLERSLGTLGGGNHFIEIDVDEGDNKYLIVHTGSRNLGKQVADYYQEMANQLCNFNKVEYDKEKEVLIESYKNDGRKSEIKNALGGLVKKYKVSANKIPKELAYLEGQHKEDYLNDMLICQEFAEENRYYIAYKILKKYFDFKNDGDLRIIYEDKPKTLHTQDKRKFDFSAFETVHNYMDFDDGIIRKGAIKATAGKKVLIPINMRDGCIIAIGKGNADWNNSAPHGAGRIMSRAKAREVLKLKDFKSSMEGVYTTTADISTLDEAPMAYKPMQEIIDNIKDTVEIVKIIKPIYNFKASEIRVGDN